MITLCMTIGRRPDLLEKTLISLQEHRFQFEKIIAINDFRDEPTNQMFRTLCPHGQLISLDDQLGHHAAVDRMYEQVTTPYVFHCEDDWVFDREIRLESCIALLDAEPLISQICFRRVTDFNFSDIESKNILQTTTSDVHYARLDRIHPQWHGYTFNPHLASLDLWRQLGKFSQFKKERHISRALRKQGRFSAYLEPGCCTHIGELQSVSQSAVNPTGLRWLRKKIKSMLIRMAS